MTREEIIAKMQDDAYGSIRTVSGQHINEIAYKDELYARTVEAIDAAIALGKASQG